MNDPPPPAEIAAAAETLQSAAVAVEAAGVTREARPNDVTLVAVRGIIIITVLALLGAIGLILDGGQPPDGVVAIASAGIGSLSTLLTVRGTRGEPR